MGRAKDWCILRTSGPRTLKLAASLVGAGFDVWTPTMTAQRRKGRKRERVDCPAPITPTFVFARAAQLGDLIREASALASPHPPFSVFRYRDRIPLLADRSLSALRSAEEQDRLKHLKATRRTVPAGTSIKLTEGAFAGMTGIVEGGNGKEAVVNFGGGFVVSIATYLLESDVIQSANKPDLGIAA